jgi:hypothetical protein
MDWWCAHHLARSYDKIVFDPTGTDHDPKHHLNLFTGFTFTRENSVKGDVSPILNHLRDVWYKGAPDANEYFLDWLAGLIQFPGRKMKTVPVAKGGQGTGKSMIAHFLRKIMGDQYFSQVLDINQLTGTFNSSDDMTNLLTFLDECTFSGDKAQANKIKGFVSEVKRKHEAKFVNRIEVKNHSNVMICANGDSCTNRECDDRRYFCTEVDGLYSGVQTPESKCYFDRIGDVSPSAFAYFLYNRDISDFNPCAFPSTKYGRYQKLIGLETAHAFIDWWIKDDLSGVTPFCGCAKCNKGCGHNKCELGPYGVPGTFKIPSNMIFLKYRDWQITQPTKRTIIQAVLFKMFDTVFQMSPGYKPNTRPTDINGNRYFEHILPSVDECKKSFALTVKEPQWYLDGVPVEVPVEVPVK